VIDTWARLIVAWLCIAAIVALVVPDNWSRGEHLALALAVAALWMATFDHIPLSGRRNNPQ